MLDFIAGSTEKQLEGWGGGGWKGCGNKMTAASAGENVMTAGCTIQHRSFGVWNVIREDLSCTDL